ncbi:MAG: FAD/NAD(P)-binding protein [Candidatus Cybelea sp.]
MLRQPLLQVCDVSIVGGGFSGAAVAAQLARRAPKELSAALFEPNELGRGAAYGTSHDAHVLNTRARAMSLFPDEPDHFVRWLGARAKPDDFVSRRLYGAYVNQVARRAFERPNFLHVTDRAVHVRRDGHHHYVVESRGGAQFAARTVILATGNPPPGDTFLPRGIRLHPGYIADPWRFDYRKVGGHVLVIGSGLSALDVLVALDACGHRGTVHIVSRRGRFPNVHADVAPYDVIPALDTRDARALLRSLRTRVTEARMRGFDWRAVLDALRPETEAIWRRLSQQEQQRFERHLRGQWERHRHRSPQGVDAVRDRYRDAKRLFTYAGTIRGTQNGSVTIALRDGTTKDVHADWIVNCTGVAGASAMAADPLLANLLTDGLITAAPGGLGLQTTPNLEAVGASRLPVQGLYVVGPPVRGSRFEATAVPELRAMAEQVATHLLQGSERAKAARA